MAADPTDPRVEVVRGLLQLIVGGLLLALCVAAGRERYAAMQEADDLESSRSAWSSSSGSRSPARPSSRETPLLREP